MARMRKYKGFISGKSRDSDIVAASTTTAAARLN